MGVLGQPVLFLTYSSPFPKKHPYLLRKTLAPQYRITKKLFKLRTFHSQKYQYSIAVWELFFFFMKYIEMLHCGIILNTQQHILLADKNYRNGKEDATSAKKERCSG
jgi:hypothetical protein